MNEVVEGGVLLTLGHLQQARQIGYDDGAAGGPRDPATHGIHTHRGRAQYYQGHIRGQFGWPLHPYCAMCHDNHAEAQHTRTTDKPGRVA